MLDSDATTSRSAPLRACRVVSLNGYVAYNNALKLQYAAQAALQQGRVANTLYLLEHLPVITIGRGAGSGDKDFLTKRSALLHRGIEVLDADRGGDTTYHAPGQLIGYSIVNLAQRGRDLHAYLRALESVIVSALAEFEIRGAAIPGLTGVWVGQRKIAAIGIKVSRWVSIHGFSINNDLDLRVMRRDIVPCGIQDKDVVSLAELGVCASRERLESILAAHWSQAFSAGALGAPEYVRRSWSEELRRIEAAEGEEMRSTVKRNQD